LIQSGKITLEPLITKHFPFEDYPKAFEYIAQNPDLAMKVIIDL
jgi:threonine dehydrogenase-like Zn-dependent dehydrogenase